jgi:para-nitrobenzyl esterase
MQNLIRSLLIVCGVSLAAGSTHASPKPVTPLVQLDSGSVRGIDQDDMHVFLGIPYAAPPVGKLRWMPPEPPKHWAGVLNATKFGSNCAQNDDLGVFAKAGGDEDCLYLNVYVSKEAAESHRKLPVLVWIHGGALLVGAGRDYNPIKLAAEGKAVVVTINYRVGLLGFFANPAIDREGHEFANYGFMDQLSALGWVQRDIAGFGGNPGNVTIFGESSGGCSVFALMAAPQAAGKFQHVIAMSGAAIALIFPTFGSPKPLNYGEQVGASFAKKVGCADGDVAGCLRKLTTRQILANQTRFAFRQPIIDGRLLPTTPAKAFRTGNFNHVTLVNGSTQNEGTFFAGLPENATGVAMTAQDYPNQLLTFYTDKALTERILKEYPLKDYNTPSEAWAAAVTSSLFACPALAIDRWLADKIPVYAYEFADRTAPSYLNPTTFPQGAAHTSELPYIFPGFHGGAGRPITLNPLQEILSDQMVAYWTHAWDSTALELTWPRYNPAQDDFMTLILPSPHMTSGQFSNLHHCAFWDSTGLY